MREVILYIATSLDGYIADDRGGVAWLQGDGSGTETMGSYPLFIDTVDTVILGYTTYHQIVTELSPDKWIYSGKQSYVLTHRKQDAKSEIIFTDEDLPALVGRLKKQQGKHIWICGGASIVNQCLSLGLIDRYHLTVIPTILGGGVRLFGTQNQEMKLRLLSTACYNGMVDLVYTTRDHSEK